MIYNIVDLHMLFSLKKISYFLICDTYYIFLKVSNWRCIVILSI